MPSLIPVLCNMPWAQKDKLGCEDSTKAKHCDNHVTPLCPELLSSSPKESYCLPAPRKGLLQVLETWPTLYLHNSLRCRVFSVMFSPMSSTGWLVHVSSSPLSLGKRHMSNFAFSAHKHNTTQQSTIPVLGISCLLNGKSNLNK
jgi:hypothetical protein